jgi:RimJ/RimL family protein N-acetyltransferase
MPDGPLRVPPLQTGRLLILELRQGDIEGCSRLFSAIGWDDPKASETEQLGRRRSWLDWTVRSYLQLDRLTQPPYGERAVTLKETGEFVGLIGLVPALGPFEQLPALGGAERARWTTEVGLFWAIAPEHQRRGYAIEAARALAGWAFEHLRLKRVIATTETANAASIAVMRRLGMRVEANPQPDPPWFQTVGVLEAEAWGWT